MWFDMPNWCENTVKASKKVLDMLYDKKNKTYSMDTILPVPSILYKVQNGSKPTWNESLEPLSKGDIEFLTAHYGAPDWYTWQNKYRGTKWDFTEPHRDTDNILSFDTAWGPPLEFFTYLSSLYPADEIILEAHEPGVGLHAEFIITNGGIDSEREIPSDDEERSDE